MSYTYTDDTDDTLSDVFNKTIERNKTTHPYLLPTLDELRARGVWSRPLERALSENAMLKEQQKRTEYARGQAVMLLKLAIELLER